MVCTSFKIARDAHSRYFQVQEMYIYSISDLFMWFAICASSNRQLHEVA